MMKGVTERRGIINPDGSEGEAITPTIPLHHHILAIIISTTIHPYPFICVQGVYGGGGCFRDVFWCVTYAYMGVDESIVCGFSVECVVVVLVVILRVVVVVTLSVILGISTVDLAVILAVIVVILVVFEA